METQKIIAKNIESKLKTITKLIEQKNKQIQLLKEKRQAIINQAVTRGVNPDVKLVDSGIDWWGMTPTHWIKNRLKNYLGIQGGFAFSSFDYVDSGTQLIKIANVYQNQLCLDRSPTFLPEEYSLIYRNYRLSKNDIIISLTGTINKEDYAYAIKIHTDDHYLLNQRVGRVVFKEKCNIDYFYYLLRSSYCLSKIYSSTTGTKQANLNEESITAIQVYIPSTSEQGQIVNEIKDASLKIDKIISTVQITIKLLAEYKISVINYELRLNNN